MLESKLKYFTYKTKSIMSSFREKFASYDHEGFMDDENKGKSSFMSSNSLHFETLRESGESSARTKQLKKKLRKLGSA